MGFVESFREVEQRFRKLAGQDGDIYLPNFTPHAPVDYMLVGMEPSLGRWARSADEAKAQVAAGFRNFMWSPEDFILHLCARRYLCEGGQTYHVTDVSKGAMLVERANTKRGARYARWYELLVQEIELIAKPGARVIAIGRAVETNLRALGLSRPLARVIHYSGQASRARKAAIKGLEEEFRTFAATLGVDDIVAAAAATLHEHSVPETLAASTLARLSCAKVTESRKMLVFAYKVAFEAIRST
ncbi:MAG: hypothetical protein HYZ53_08285 [Planctomycetes bacterium]|nr:hypothetical protein [Planctomycetota bacterium]